MEQGWTDKISPNSSAADRFHNPTPGMLALVTLQIICVDVPQNRFLKNKGPGHFKLGMPERSSNEFKERATTTI